MQSYSRVGAGRPGAGCRSGISVPGPVAAKGDLHIALNAELLAISRSRAGSPQEVADGIHSLWSVRGDQFNAVNRVTALNELASARRQGASIPATLVSNALAGLQGNLSALDARGLSNLSGSLFTLRQHEAPLTLELAQHSRGRLNEFQPSDLAYLAWAFSRLKRGADDLFRGICDRATKLLQREVVTQGSLFEPRDKARLSRAFALLDIRNRKFYLALKDASFATSNDFDARSRASLMRGFAENNIYYPDLTQEMTLGMIRDRAGWDAESVASFARALAIYDDRGVEARLFMSEAVLYAQTNTGNFSSPSVLHLFSAGAVLLESNEFQRLWMVVSPRLSLCRFSDEGAVQLYQAALAQGVESELPQGLRGQIDGALAASQTHPPRPGSFEAELSGVLRRLGLTPDEQVFESGYFIDNVVRVRGVPWAIESDGSRFHHVGGEPQNGLIGSTRLKHDNLRRRGYHVLSIHDIGWKGLRHRRVPWLRHQLRL